MEIKTVEYKEHGGFLVNKDATPESQGEYSVPDDMGNRHRVMIQEWMDKGNTPTPYVEPEPHWIDKRLANVANGGYGSIGEQLDYIFHHGVEKWKEDMIIPVKNKHPKE